MIVLENLVLNHVLNHVLNQSCSNSIMFQINHVPNQFLRSSLPASAVDNEGHRGGRFGCGLPKVEDVPLVLAVGNLGIGGFGNLRGVGGGFGLGVGKTGQQSHRQDEKEGFDHGFGILPPP